MKPEDYRAAVTNLAFMKELPGELREKVAAVFDEVGVLRAAPKGMAWLRQGEHTPDKGYLLLQGTAAIRKMEHPEFSCEAPELLGEIMQFDPRHLRSATVSAATDCVLLRFMWPSFWEACEDHLTQDECSTVKTAIESCAWSHIAN